MKDYFTEKTPDSLARYNDSAHLLLSRAEYSVGQFDLSENELKLIQKKSNDLTDSLSELSWADLMQERYPEAIGTSMNLEAGGLRHTFAPEAPMVAAMAMNELCQYPDAVREITIFRKNYEKSFKWLENWVANETNHSNLLYQQAIQFIRRKSEVPDRVGGEWVRSPLFIASQDEINTYFDEKDTLPKVAPIAAASERAMAQEILKHARELKPELKIAKMKLKQGDQLPGKIRKLARGPSQASRSLAPDSTGRSGLGGRIGSLPPDHPTQPGPSDRASECRHSSAQPPHAHAARRDH